MSRSYKKSPVYTDGTPRTTKEMKRIANSKVRNTKGNYKGKSYKKLFCSYDIHDWITRWSWEQAKKDWETSMYIDYKGDVHYTFKDDYPTLKEFRKYWEKYHKRK